MIPLDPARLPVAPEDRDTLANIRKLNDIIYVSQPFLPNSAWKDPATAFQHPGECAFNKDCQFAVIVL